MYVYRITPSGQVSLFASLFGNNYYDPDAVNAGTLGLELTGMATCGSQPWTS